MALDKDLVLGGFGVERAAIIDPATGLEAALGQLYGVRAGTLAVDVNTADITGDDVILDTWKSINKGTLSITSGYISFQTWAKMSSSNLKSTGLTGGALLEAPFLEERQLNVASMPVLLRVKARTASGKPRYLHIVLFKVNFAPIHFDGPNFQAGLNVNYDGDVLMSDTDENGDPVVDSVTGLPTRALGKLVMLSN